MRAGTLDRTITIQASTTTVDQYGTATEAWTDFAPCRAQLVTATTTDFLKAYGETETAVAVFRIRWLDGVNANMRVAYNGQNYLIMEITEIGRRIGLELRTQLLRAETT
jgi:SPP1 family predicted phage head-tail adaptor